MDKFHEKYLRDTETLDGATGHLDSLQKAAARGRIPAKMTIKIKLLVLNKDNEQFKTEWQTAIQDSKRKLLKTVLDHLQRMIEQTNADIRRSTNEMYKRLKASGDKDKAKQHLERMLKQATRNNRRKPNRGSRGKENSMKRPLKSQTKRPNQMTDQLN